MANNHTISLDYTLSNDVIKTGNEYYQLWLVFNFTGHYLQVNNNSFFDDQTRTGSTR